MGLVLLALKRAPSMGRLLLAVLVAPSMGPMLLAVLDVLPWTLSPATVMLGER